MPHAPHSVLRDKRGFTIIEILIFSAIFVVIMTSFISIFVVITRVQTRSSAASEVNQQSQFLLQQIQYYIERSSLVELAQDVVTSTLKLRMPSAAEDPTWIYLSSNTVYLRQATATAQALTSSKVNVAALNFTNRSNAPAHDSVNVSFTVANNTSNLQQQFSETLSTSIARVSAATFDSNVVPSSTATYKLGVSGNIWSSVNDLINFSGSNVGVNLGAGNPSQTFEVGNSAGGGDIYVSGAGRGIILKSPGGTCVKLTYTNNGQLATSSFTCT